MGRWASRDPIVELGALLRMGETLRNRDTGAVISDAADLLPEPDIEDHLAAYAFVLNDPLNGFDILGLTSDLADECPEGWVWGPLDPAIAEIPAPDGCSLVPDRFDGCAFTPACDGHDLCYSDCDMSRRDCDRRFLDDLRAACEECSRRRPFPGDRARRRWLRRCRRRARVYYRGVRVLGRGPYVNRQREACGCMCDITYYWPGGNAPIP